MADWDKFWELVDRKVPAEAVRAGNSDIGIYGDYLEGQFVKEQLNQVCREAGLRWMVDWSTVRTDTMGEPFRYFVSYMTGDLVITDGTVGVRRPGMGVGRCMCPFDRDKQEVMPTPADHQIDTVMKTALTDFIKNAAMRFGRYFGGELYFDERMAGVLGWEIASDRVARRTSDVAPADLGSYTIHPGGWGKDKKFGGMSLAELYEDPDGLGAMAWAATLDAPRSATAKMAQYFKMREQEEEGGVPDRMSLDEYDESVTPEDLVDAVIGAKPGEMVTIMGRRVPAKNTLSPEWASYVKGRIAQTTGTALGLLFGHNNHVINHLKSHYNVAKVIDLTGEKAAALVRYIDSGGKDADPRWYAEPEIPVPSQAVSSYPPGTIFPVPTGPEVATFPSGEAIAQPMEQLFGPESVEDLLKKAAPNLPEAWRDKPVEWWATLCKQFSIGILNAKQLETVRFLLEAVASGNMSLEDTDSPTYKIFVDGMQKVSSNGVDIPH